MITQTPRDYQTNIVQRSSVKLRAAKSIITHAPTGAGKTLIIEMVVDRALRARRYLSCRRLPKYTIS